MTVIRSLPPARSSLRPNYRLYLVLGIAIGACTRIVVRWTVRNNDAYNAAVLQMPNHIQYFPHGEKGYLKDHYCIDNSNRDDCCSDYQCTHFVNRSTLYSECCGRVHNTDHKPTTKSGIQRSHLLPLLITSAPRSGTRFIQQLFTRVGLSGLTNDEHSPQHRGTVSWKHVFDDEHYHVAGSASSATHLYQSKFRVVWHLVRDPLKALTSLAFTEPLLEDSWESERYVGYIAKHIHLTNATKLKEFYRIGQDEWAGRSNGTYNEKIDKFLIYRSMEIYLHWHGFINYLNVPMFRLEDLSVNKNITVLDEVFRSVGMTPPNHALVQTFLDAQPPEDNNYDWNWRRRLLEGQQLHGNHGYARKFGRDQNGGLKVQLHKNERDHRQWLSWEEVCNANKRKAKELLLMSQSFGYYPELDVETLCPTQDE